MIDRRKFIKSLSSLGISLPLLRAKSFTNKAQNKKMNNHVKKIKKKLKKKIKNNEKKK